MNRRHALAIATGAALAPISALARKGAPAPLPPGYVAVAQRTGVPAMVLYGVALQESKRLWGEVALPWPWTLNNNSIGKAYRYKSYQEAVAAMRGFLAAGQRNVDTCLMQVNWRWHSEKLQTVERALDPYPNIFVGAQLLSAHYARTRDWFKAIGRYHYEAGGSRADEYAASVFKHLRQVPSINGVARG